MRESGLGAPQGRAVTRFGVTADAHLIGRAGSQNRAYVERFTEAMRAWRPDFVIDLGDFLYHCGEPKEEHIQALRRHWTLYRSAGCPAYAVLGNHDADWLRQCPDAGPGPLWPAHREATGMPGRFYSFDAGGLHVIVLDGNTPRPPSAGASPDGHQGAFWLDELQMEWLAGDLRAHRGRPKIVFCHQELHYTPPEGSGEGGQVPFPQVGSASSHVDNGWEARRLFSADGEVIACFAGHKHHPRWVVHGGVHYITLAATHRAGSYSQVTLSDSLRIEGFGEQPSCDLPLPA